MPAAVLLGSYFKRQRSYRIAEIVADWSYR